MTEMSKLLDRWLDWHVHYGTLLARSWTPDPAPQAAIEAAMEKTGPWPPDLIDFYLWSDGCPYPLLPHGGWISSLSRLKGATNAGSPDFDNPNGWFDDTKNLLIHPQYPCTFVDLTGPTRGRVWRNDVGDVGFIANSLSEHFSSLLERAEAGEFSTVESDGHYLHRY